MDEKYSLTAAEEKALKTFLNRRLGADLEWNLLMKHDKTNLMSGPLTTTQKGLLSQVFEEVTYYLDLTPKVEGGDIIFFEGELQVSWKDWLCGTNGLRTGIFISIKRTTCCGTMIWEESSAPVFWEDE